jgi:hypothetical protein
MPTKNKATKPIEVVLFETELKVKFDGPYNDGREWDTKISTKNNLESMIKIGELGKWLKEKGFKRNSEEVNSTFAFHLKKGVDLGIDVNSEGLQITIYYDD